MNLLAPVLIVLGVAIPATLARNGVSMRALVIGACLYGLAGLILFAQGLRAADPAAAATGDPGQFGTIGILIIISALFAGITLTFTAIIRVMSRGSKG